MLATTVFKDYRYFSFEDLDVCALVKADPRAFLNRYKDEKGVILDEIQHVPELLSYMQTLVDSTRKKGHFIITGSQNLLVTQAISQSLAGRVALLTLLPLSINELVRAQVMSSTIDEMLFKGSYPGLYTDVVSIEDWQRSYNNSYIEQDVRQIQNITDLSRFQIFMKLCVRRIGQVLNIISLSNDMGMSVHAVKQWLSVLEASYIIFLSQPYYKNFSKRVIKAPKLYFYDIGIAYFIVINYLSRPIIYSLYAR
jgi:predicted AAA+ superfamily ATPase